MGRPRKPTALKILDGDRKDRIHGDEPTAPTGLGEPPDWFDRFAKEAWERLETLHRATGLLTRLDSEAAMLYCQSYSTYRHALKTITEDLAEKPQKPFGKLHPYHRLVKTSQAEMMRFLSKSGMTPSDRAGLHVAATPDSDPLLAFLARSNAKAQNQPKKRGRKKDPQDSGEVDTQRE